MEIKKFSEYSKEEQKELLYHWWHYYGKIPYTTDELERFNKMLDEDIDFVRKSALIAYTGGVSSQDMIKAWRDGVFDEYRKSVEEFVLTDSFKRYEVEIESDFVSDLVNSYNNPEPDIPLSADQIIEMIESIVGSSAKDDTIIIVGTNGLYMDDHEIQKQSESVLTSDNVYEVYKECMLTDGEVDNDMPLVDFVVGEGITSLGVFNSERLAINKEKIADMVDCVADIENGPSFLSMCTDKNGNLWTGDQGIIDLLVQLGIACEILEYPLSKDMWDVLPGSVPLVIRTHEKDNDNLRTHKPKEFTKVVDEVKKDTYRNKGNVE